MQKQKSDVEAEVSFLAVYEHKAPDVQIEDKDMMWFSVSGVVWSHRRQVNGPDFFKKILVLVLANWLTSEPTG